MWDEEIFNKAMFFAIKAHGNQKMKNPEETPYFAHIFGVTQNLIKNAIEDNAKIDWNFAVQVALLHDTIEDTAITYDDIKQNFGERVANGVFALTKNLDLPKREQIIDSIQRIIVQPKEVAMVKLSDRLFNIRDRVPSWNDEKLKYYKIDAQIICDSLGFVSPSLKKALQHAIDIY